MQLNGLRQTLLALAITLLGSFGATASPDDVPVTVIAHPDLDPDYLSPKYLRAAFSMHLRTWPDGQPVHFFVMDDNNVVHKEFCRQYLGTYPYVLRTIWDRRVFTGTGIQPEVVRDEAEMRRRVLSTPGAIGYARPDETDSAIPRRYNLSARSSQ